MKALQINIYAPSPSHLLISTIPPPSAPSPTHLLIRITHTALNHVDLLYSAGTHQNNHIGLVRPPFILGLEFAGHVASTPPPGSGLKVGDEVWGSGLGGFAECIVVDVGSVRKIPRGWNLRNAAGLGAATAPVSYGALVRVAGVRAGQTVLIHAAAGGLGVVAVQIAHALGAKVIGTVGSEEKARVVRKLGVLGVVRYDLPEWEKEVLRVNGGEGVDVVYDTVGLVEKSIRCIKFGGTVVIAGFAGREGKMETMAMNRILLKGARVLGYVSICSSYPSTLFV